MNILGKLLKSGQTEMLELQCPNGNHYFGASKDGKLHGMGVCIYANGDKYTGNFKFGNMHGFGRMEYCNNDIYKGNWENNLMHMHGTYINANGDKYIGEWRHGKAHGHGIAEYSNGDYYSGEFLNNLYHGRGTIIYANHEKYIGDFKNGKYHGLGTEILGVYHFYMGEYRDGIKHGQGMALLEDGSTYFGEFFNGRYNGHGIGVEAHNNIFIGEFKDNNYCGHGRYIEAYGEKEWVGEWHNNQLHGNATTYYRDGTWFNAEFNNGISSGHVNINLPSGDKISRWMKNDQYSIDFKSFLRSESQDFKGRYLSDIWNFSDEEIELTHDFISLVFPLDKPSENTFHGFYLNDESVTKEISVDKIARSNLKRSAAWFFSYLQRNNAWKSNFNHNQFRITRIIRSLRLLVSGKVADKFYQDVLELLDKDHVINEKSLVFWAGA